MKRGANRAVYSPEQIKELLGEGLIAHVGVTTNDGPVVLPMAYGVRDDEILIHGSVANAMMRSGRSTDVCITVTIIDGLVVARTPFHNSMNYRSVVVRGEAKPITGDEDLASALQVINDHIAPIWDTARAPSDVDYKQTMVLSVSLAEASAKVRAGDPIDEDQDLAGPHWAGVVPLVSTWGTAHDAANLASGIEIPSAVKALDGNDAHA